MPGSSRRRSIPSGLARRHGGRRQADAVESTRGVDSRCGSATIVPSKSKTRRCTADTATASSSRMPGSKARSGAHTAQSGSTHWLSSVSTANMSWPQPPVLSFPWNRPPPPAEHGIRAMCLKMRAPRPKTGRWLVQPPLEVLGSSAWEPRPSRPALRTRLRSWDWTQRRSKSRGAPACSVEADPAPSPPRPSLLPHSRPFRHRCGARAMPKRRLSRLQRT